MTFKRNFRSCCRHWRTTKCNHDKVIFSLAIKCSTSINFIIPGFIKAHTHQPPRQVAATARAHGTRNSGRSIESA